MKKFFFILINNNEKKILPTLKSRCLTFKINLTFTQSIDIANRILNKNILDHINKNIIDYYISPGEIINLVNIAEDKKINLLEHDLESLIRLLIDNKYYKKDKVIKQMIINFIELFFLKKYRLTNAKNSLLHFYHEFLDKIHNMEKFNLDEESLFLEIKSKLLHE